MWRQNTDYEYKVMYDRELRYGVLRVGILVTLRMRSSQFRRLERGLALQIIISYQH